MASPSGSIAVKRKVVKPPSSASVSSDESASSFQKKSSKSSSASKGKKQKSARNATKAAGYLLALAIPVFCIYRAYTGYTESVTPKITPQKPEKGPSSSSSATSEAASSQPSLPSAKLWPSAAAIPGEEVTRRRETIKAAFKTSWNAYERDAFGFDNYHPISQHGSNLESAGIGYFIVDCIDSLQIFGLEEEYARARNWVATELSFDVDDKHHAFETTIRVLGGLLSAYHLSDHDKLYLDKAIDLADRLMPIFDTASGLPLSFINLQKREGIADADNMNFTSVAEAGTLQLELKYLAELTGNFTYWKRAEDVMRIIHRNPKTGGLVPMFLDSETGQFEVSEIRLGSRADSYYEYLLKQYLQTNRIEKRYQQMYLEAMAGIQEHLVKLSPIDRAPYTIELAPSMHPQTGDLGFARIPKQDHLVCFLGGLLLLGTTEGAPFTADIELSPEAQRNWILGEQLTKTCVDTYTQSQTGLGAEIVFYYKHPQEKVYYEDSSDRAWYIDKRKPQRPGQPKPDPPIDARNILRPETVESLFVGWRLTHDPIYREWGWQIFQAFDKHCKIGTGGYASIRDVDEVPVVHEDRMETFFLSETLKYLFLLFSEDDVIPLDKYVFNTEAHPLPIFTPSFFVKRPE